MAVKDLGAFSAAEDTLQQGQHYVNVILFRHPLFKVITMRKDNLTFLCAVTMTVIERRYRGTKRF